MPLAKITLSSAHTDRCTCGHVWTLHSSINGWCVLCDCKQYVQVEPDQEQEAVAVAEPQIQTPKGKLIFGRPADDLEATRSFAARCICGHTWGQHVQAHPTARCGFCDCASFDERKGKEDET